MASTNGCHNSNAHNHLDVVNNDDGESSRSPPMASERSGLFFSVPSGEMGTSPELSTSPTSNGHSNGGGSVGQLRGTRFSQQRIASTRHMIAMVGLPARGKTYISKNLARYLNWIGVKTKVINLGDYRRQCVPYQDHSVFSPDNVDGSRLRSEICERGLKDAINFLVAEGGEVVVFDATNTTKVRRQLLYERMVEDSGFNLFFIESICDDEDIIDANIKSVKVTSPDYIGFSEAQVLTDFRLRISHYVNQYETIDERAESHLSFMKIIDAGRKLVVHKHEGHIQSRIVYYLMNIRITPRVIYLARHGESVFNVEGRVGGESTLTERGQAFAHRLGEHMNSLAIDRLLVWTSCLRNAVKSAAHVSGIHERWKALNEIDAGVCDGLTYKEIARKYPADYKARQEDKFSYRYCRGESYGDLVARLEPVIMQLEQQDSVLVVSHQAVVRCILAYFMDLSADKLPYLEIPLHTIIKLEPQAYGCRMTYHDTQIARVSTQHGKAVPIDQVCSGLF